MPLGGHCSCGQTGALLRIKRIKRLLGILAVRKPFDWTLFWVKEAASREALYNVLEHLVRLDTFFFRKTTHVSLHSDKQWKNLSPIAIYAVHGLCHTIDPRFCLRPSCYPCLYWEEHPPSVKSQMGESSVFWPEWPGNKEPQRQAQSEHSHQQMARQLRSEMQMQTIVWRSTQPDFQSGALVWKMRPPEQFFLFAQRSVPIHLPKNRQLGVCF